MKKSLIIMLLLTFVYLFADDLYFKNGEVWKNCGITNASSGYFSVLFVNNNELLTKRIKINKVFGIVKKEFDQSDITETGYINTTSLSKISGIQKIGPSIFYQNSDVDISEFIVEKDKIENKFLQKPKIVNHNNQLNYPIYLEGLSKYSKLELSIISSQRESIDNAEKTVFYQALKKTALPECLMNGYGLASMSQGDYEHGAIIFASQLLGTLFISLSLDNTVRTIGYGLIISGGIYGIVRPIIYADKYNEALKVGLELNYEF